MSAKVLELKQGWAAEKNKKNVMELFEWGAGKAASEEHESIMIIFPKGENGPEMMLCGVDQVELFGALESIKFLVGSGQMQFMDDVPNEEDE